VLLQGEVVQKAYQVGRDQLVFTDRRLVLVDKQGLTGSKVEYHSVPYRSVIHFSVETSGNFDLDAELKIWLTGNPVPIQREFNKKVNVFEVQAVLAAHVVR
jgi:Bacterial PH domain